MFWWVPVPVAKRASPSVEVQSKAVLWAWGALWTKNNTLCSYLTQNLDLNSDRPKAPRLRHSNTGSHAAELAFHFRGGV